MTAMEQKTCGPFSWPDPLSVAQQRRQIARVAVGQTEDFIALLRQQVLEVLIVLSRVDAQVLRLIDGITVYLGGIDIGDYRNAIQVLDKPDRTDREILAFVHYQQEITNVLFSGVQEARRYVAALDACLRELEAAPINDHRALITELESRAQESHGAQLEELRGPLQVADARDRYVHETAKLVFAVGYFLDTLLEEGAQMIPRAGIFQQHVGQLVAHLQQLRHGWES